MPASKVRVLLFLSSLVEALFALDLATTGGVFFIAYYLMQSKPGEVIANDDLLKILPISVRSSSAILIIGILCVLRALLMLLVVHLGRRWAKGKGSLAALYRTSFINLVIDLLLIFSLGVQGTLGNNSFWFSIAGLLAATFIFWCADIERERISLAEDLS